MDAAPSGNPSAPIVQQELVAYINLVIAQTRILSSVMCGVYVWEWLTNLSAEYTLIWKAKIGFLNVVFLLLRYYTFVVLGLLTWMTFWEGEDKQKCARMILMLPYLPLALFVLANVIIIARVYAMWNKDKRVLAFLRVLCCAQIVVQAYMPRILKPMQFPSDIKACGGDINKIAYLVYSLVAIVFDVAVLALSLMQLGMHWKVNGSMSSLARVLFRDQVMFYVLIFTIHSINLIVFYADQRYGQGKVVVAPVSAGITSIAMGRVFLNLRREAIKQGSVICSSARSGQLSHPRHQLSGAITVPEFPSPSFPNDATSRTGQIFRVRTDVEKQTDFDHCPDGHQDVDSDYQLRDVPKK